ncbi:MAG TPA: 2-amino-4-hydroxy-6-hydroxymethyldihydropteridine diphosphokinase [Terriglobia bacterium]|nr:2-amino-4-hydroxy-6-hydroxymethyldihydropteridine diphosphokinase [Terriglobia bacterium]
MIEEYGATPPSIIDLQSSIANQMRRVFLALGSNLGDRRANITNALTRLGESGVEVRRVSSFYRTEPVGYTAQPWFLNCAAQVGTDLMPLQLLQRCQAIQRALGRRPGRRNGPRAIDIDILFYGNAIVHSAELTIPHARMGERRFVLLPLSEIAGDAEHPVTRQMVREMLAGAPPGEAIRMPERS